MLGGNPALQFGMTNQISCRRRDLNPEDYLTDVLARLPSMKIHQIHELLPSQWKPPSANSS